MEGSFLAAFGEIRVCIYRSKWKLCLKSILGAITRISRSKNMSVTRYHLDTILTIVKVYSWLIFRLGIYLIYQKEKIGILRI